MRLRRTPTLLAVAVLAAFGACVGDAQSAFPGANGRIVFASNRDGAQDVYVMAADGTGQTRLTDAAGDDEYPMWSPDGTKIVFSSYREVGPKIFRMNADGSAQTRLTDPPTTTFGDEEPSWSRNGSKIVFRSYRELDDLNIWTMNADGTGLTRLTSDGSNFNPVWAPNVDRIAFTSNRDGDFEIYTMDAFGGNVVQLTSNTASDSNPDWSPDGTKLAFQSDAGGSFDVWVLSSNGLTQLTNDPAFDSAPTWSPDGTKIAFQSNRDGDFEIYTMNADGSGVVQLTDNTATDRVADWQPLVTGGSDTTPPTLVLPGPITVDATSPAGAVVSFTVSATDSVDPTPTVSCSRASGTTFPIGSTAVSCTSTDRAGNTSSGSFTVTVVGARAQLERLLLEVTTSAGPSALQRTILRTMVQSVLNGFGSPNPLQHSISCATLGTFRILVGAWSGHPIPPALADRWRADARRIQAVLNC
jgi:Tol biopolymer transport system component